VRVLRVLAGVVLAAVLGMAIPGSAQAQPPKLDVEDAIDVLGDQQIYRAPGAVAHLDETRVRPVLDKNTRVLVAPYTGEYEQGANYTDSDDHTRQVYDPLDKWAEQRHLHLIMVEGIRVTLIGEPAIGVGPSTIPELRQTTAYLDVSSSVIFAARYAGGNEDNAGDFDYPNAQPVAPTTPQVDDLVAHLRSNPVYNAPGRDDPVDPRIAQLAKDEYGLTVRIATFPVLAPGEPVVSYAPKLLEQFPGEIIMVAQGRWLDVAAADQDKADSARDYAYGAFENSSFLSGNPMQDRVGTVLERLQFLLKGAAYGRPQPQPQPEPRPFDVRRAISDLTPWVLVGAALVLGAAGLVTWRRGHAERADKERRALRRERAKAMARIGDLGARLLAVAERGEKVDPAAAERHATARTLYDQALTSAAMAEVATVAEEGIEVMA
jgi:hypothetical protein